MNNTELELKVKDTVKQTLLDYTANNNISFDMIKANDYFKKTFYNKFDSIIDEVNKCTRKSDFFNQIDNGYYSPLVKQVFQTTLIYECLQYAKEIINNSKNE
jgi:hypothetical protein